MREKARSADTEENTVEGERKEESEGRTRGRECARSERPREYQGEVERRGRHRENGEERETKRWRMMEASPPHATAVRPDRKRSV